MLFLDVTKVSYNNEKSKLLNKSHSVLKDIEFTSFTDYCDDSDKKSVKRKSTKLETKKNPKSKNKKISQSTEENVIASDQTINCKSSTIVSFKENDNGVEKVLNITPINVESLDSININRITEVSRVNKYLNKSIKGSTVFDKTSNNIHLLSKKINSVNDKAHLNVVLSKPLPPIKLEKPRNSSLTSSKSRMNSKNRPSNMKSISMTQTKNNVGIQPTRNLFQPTLEPKQIKEEKHEKHEINGMFQLFFFLQHRNKWLYNIMYDISNFGYNIKTNYDNIILILFK